jgi:hypothetical protein
LALLRAFSQHSSKWRCLVIDREGEQDHYFARHTTVVMLCSLPRKIGDFLSKPFRAPLKPSCKKHCSALCSLQSFVFGHISLWLANCRMASLPERREPSAVAREIASRLRLELLFVSRARGMIGSWPGRSLLA